MTNQGYIKIHRKILDNPIVFKDSETVAIWLYLLLNASHKNIDVLFKGKRITMESGQLITGTLSISKKLKINKDKVQRTLKLFESDKQIEQQTSNRNRLITIVNWGMYQKNDKQNDKQVINKCETDDKQLITNNNVKNVKNEKEKRNIQEKIFKKPSLIEVQDYINEKKLSVSAESFIDYYEGNGWKIGKNNMKDWKATIRNWHRRQKSNNYKKPDWYNKEIQEDKATDEDIKQLEGIIKKL